MKVRAVSKNRTLHWLIAVFVALALASGYGAQQIQSFSGEFLRVHLAAGLLAGLLSLVRLAIWLVAGGQASTLARQSKGIDWAIKTVHGFLRVLPVVLLVSGVGMLGLTGAAPEILSGNSPDPELLAQTPPQSLHHRAAFALLILMTGHIAAAIWHRLAERGWKLEKEPESTAS
ncbi:cytochrome b/b6 domain-containing protein [Roseibium alexandrii]|uniref:cytochrome b/b6 domain-containing protein n=1 Tax=Roseibium alexandrii TaxID=388408 RepID=UPI003750ED52